MDYRKHPEKIFAQIISTPIIYAMIIPLMIFDVSIELYHRLCFPLYGISIIRRRDHFIFDRARLPYLNIFEKINCLYCSYANGLLAYATEIAARTEAYWCGIKHKKRVGYHQPAHHKNFLAYGDKAAYRRLLK